MLSLISRTIALASGTLNCKCFEDEAGAEERPSTTPPPTPTRRISAKLPTIGTKSSSPTKSSQTYPNLSSLRLLLTNHLPGKRSTIALRVTFSLEEN